jgi:hypothetical protein
MAGGTPEHAGVTANLARLLGNALSGSWPEDPEGGERQARQELERRVQELESKLQG